jgi:hypothetical protein
VAELAARACSGCGKSQFAKELGNDPEGYKAYVTDREQAFHRTLAEQQEAESGRSP